MTSEERRQAVDRELHEQMVAEAMAKPRSSTGSAEGFRRKANEYHQRHVSGMDAEAARARLTDLLKRHGC